MALCRNCGSVPIHHRLSRPVNPRVGKSFRRLSASTPRLENQLGNVIEIDDILPITDSPSHRRRSSASSSAQKTLSSKFDNIIHGSKLAYCQQTATDFPVTPPPPPSSSSSRSQQTRGPQLSVMGYRSDMLTVHSKPLLPVTKSFKTNISSSNKTIKQWIPKPHQAYRWKTKPSSSSRVNNYPDPMYNADSTYLQRITEMAGLEVETMKLEKWKKSKRK